MFGKSFESPNVEGGLLGQYLIFQSDHRRDLPKKHVTIEHPRDVIKRIYEICDIPFEWERVEEGYGPRMPAGGRETGRSEDLMAISRMAESNRGEYQVHPALPDCKKSVALVDQGIIGPSRSR
jgi:hypothetical protein